MARDQDTSSTPETMNEKIARERDAQAPKQRWNPFARKQNASSEIEVSPNFSSDEEEPKKTIAKWSLGILNDKLTDEVPGSILLMSKLHEHNEPLGLRTTISRASASNLPSPYRTNTDRTPSISVQSPDPRAVLPRAEPVRNGSSPRIMRLFSYQSAKSHKSVVQEKKKTADGKIILEPQPDDSLNDPLNWPSLRRDIALLSLGFYCMLGGGMTPVLAAGFTNVAETYDVSVPSVALTTGFYMTGLGVGSVIASPTAIMFGKRPVYLVGAILLIISSIWCAVSPSYISLVVARVFQGIAISPVECLPSATIAEIFFLHERAYRLGIYTLLLLGGKNLIPLVSAAIIESLGWRWVFWIVAIVAGFCLSLLFFFVPETFWDRTPRSKVKGKHHLGSLSHIFNHKKSVDHTPKLEILGGAATSPDGSPDTIAQRRQKTQHHVGFADRADATIGEEQEDGHIEDEKAGIQGTANTQDSDEKASKAQTALDDAQRSSQNAADVNSRLEADKHNYMSRAQLEPESQTPSNFSMDLPHHGPISPHVFGSGASTPTGSLHFPTYTSHLQQAPPKTYKATLKIWHGRLNKDNWFKVALRPFVLFAYPSILWSTLVYSLSIGWLVVLSESVSEIYRQDYYHFSAIQTGLVYLSPFIGGILGSAVAGKISDIVVRRMSRRNDGIYEPEFRLVMAIPVMLTTVIGLMGFGWSAQERDNFIDPTIFFGIISFGCSLGSTTAITFAVDSYRQYAGEALVTLNFSKNIFHGLVFSLFFPNWLQTDGSKSVFLAIGGIQVACLLTTIPMYIYGKRARMWTVRKNMMGRL